MDDPLEVAFAKMLMDAGIEFTRPERDAREPTNLDFYLPEIGIYVEIKQFHTPRIADQLAQLPQQKSALVLVGPQSVKDFMMLIAALTAKLRAAA